MKYIKMDLTFKEKLLFLFYSLIGEEHFIPTKRTKHKHETKRSEYDEKKARIKEKKVETKVMKRVPFFDLAGNNKIERKGDW